MAVKKARRCTRVSTQKPHQQTLKKKSQQQSEPTISSKNKKAVIIAQEIKFARLLASNDKRVRDKVFKNLKKWLTVRSKSSFPFTESDFTRLWKGLFYCMWMSDKPLVQEELAESLSKIVHCFDDKDAVALYTNSALQTLGTEWFGIDQYRLDKFAMLVRRIIRQTFKVCKDKAWDMEWITGISEMLEKLLLNPKTCLGFNMHITEVFMEELSKVSSGDIPENVVTKLVKPFSAYLIAMDDERQIRHVMKNIFRYLIIQSDVGLEYMEKFEVWKQSGFRGGHIDAIQKIEVSDEDDNDDNDDEVAEEELSQKEIIDKKEKPLDPRAGRVDVELPQIPFDAKEIAELLTKYKFHPSSTTKSRRQLLRLIKEFVELSENKMPVGIKEIWLPKTRRKDTDSKSAALRLLAFEKELYSDNPQKRRKRKTGGKALENENNGDENGGDDSDEEGLNESNEGVFDEVEVDFDEDDEVASDEDDDKVLESDNTEPRRKKIKLNQKKNSNHNLAEIDPQQSDTIAAGSKKKKAKQPKKVHNNHEVIVASSNNKLKKDSTLSPNFANKPKKIKEKQNSPTVCNTPKGIISGKRKKSPKPAAGGVWDVSESPVKSTPLLIDTSTESDTKINEPKAENKKVKSTPSKSVESILKQTPVWLVPVLKPLKQEKKGTPNNTPKAQAKSNTDPSSKKRVKIVLQRNTAQHTSEYMQQIRLSPAIPYDANKKPGAGVLKASPIPSPINPFYKKSMRLSLS